MNSIWHLFHIWEITAKEVGSIYMSTQYPLQTRGQCNNVGSLQIDIVDLEEGIVTLYLSIRLLISIWPYLQLDIPHCEVPYRASGIRCCCNKPHDACPPPKVAISADQRLRETRRSCFSADSPLLLRKRAQRKTFCTQVFNEVFKSIIKKKNRDNRKL